MPLTSLFLDTPSVAAFWHHIIIFLQKRCFASSCNYYLISFVCSFVFRFVFLCFFFFCFLFLHCIALQGLTQLRQGLFCYWAFMPSFCIAWVWSLIFYYILVYPLLPTLLHFWFYVVLELTRVVLCLRIRTSGFLSFFQFLLLYRVLVRAGSFVVSFLYDLGALMWTPAGY
jgi:hypothetical protein